MKQGSSHPWTRLLFSSLLQDARELFEDWRHKAGIGQGRGMKGQHEQQHLRGQATYIYNITVELVDDDLNDGDDCDEL